MVCDPPLSAVHSFPTRRSSDLVDPTWLRVQLPLLLKLPLAEPLEKLAVPCGNDLVPESVSDTAAVHVGEPLIGNEDGVHEVVVEVVRLLTVRVNPVASELLACTESLAL